MTDQPQPLKPWTEEELDDLSMITEEDIAAAEEQWKKDVPKKYKNLLDATPEEDDQPAA